MEDKTGDRLEALAEDKKKRIIDACIEEFALKGYSEASTNSIVQKAGISKGILFHYFGSKKKLGIYIVNYVIEYMKEKFYKNNIKVPDDIFERIMHRSIGKLQMAHEEPQMYKILYDIYINPPAEIAKDLHEKFKKMGEEGYRQLFEGVDTSKFRKDIKPQKAMEMVVLVMEAIADKYVRMFKAMSPEQALESIETMQKEFLEYADILKKGIYE